MERHEVTLDVAELRNIIDPARRPILERLAEVEQLQKCYILFAVESGSREWGFASADSDYDVRGVCFFPINRYIGLDEPPEQIHLTFHSSDPTVDIVLWDIRKFARLMLKSNPSVSEWLSSKTVYMDYPGRPIIPELRHIFEQGFSRRALQMHYLNLARQNYEKYIRNKEDVNLKKYVYIIRALGAYYWLTHPSHVHTGPDTVTLPPMDYKELQSELPGWVAGNMNTFVKMKQSSEDAFSKSEPMLNDWIESHFPPRLTIEQVAPEEPDREFNRKDLENLVGGIIMEKWLPRKIDFNFKEAFKELGKQ